MKRNSALKIGIAAIAGLGLLALGNIPTTYAAQETDKKGLALSEMTYNNYDSFKIEQLENNDKTFKIGIKYALSDNFFKNGLLYFVEITGIKNDNGKKIDEAIIVENVCYHKAFVNSTGKGYKRKPLQIHRGQMGPVFKGLTNTLLAQEFFKNEIEKNTSHTGELVDKLIEILGSTDKLIKI